MSRERLFLTGVLRVVTRARRALPRPGALCALLAGIALATVPSVLQIAPRLVWNASASTPLGLYWVAVQSDLERGDLALADLPELMRQLASEREYLPPGIPLVKHVAALPGDHICTIGRALLIGGEVVARRQKRDSRGRLMPAWSGCRLLTSGEIFLLNADVSDSFDGRYFGPTRRDEVIGRLVPLWTWSVREP
jgi:conjugative transfer signal peptidase TraF